MIRVVLADDHITVRRTVLRLLAAAPGIATLSEASDLPEAIAMVRRFRPDALVVGVHMPPMSGFSIAEIGARLRAWGVQVLAISSSNDEDARTLASDMGAAELLDQYELDKTLIPAVRRLGFANERSRQGAQPAADGKSEPQ